MELMRVAAGAVRRWPLRVARGRLVRQWRLLVLVIAVATIASTALTSVGLLVTATEDSAVTRSLAAIPASQTEISLNANSATLPLARVTSRFGTVVRTLVGPGVALRDAVRAESAITPSGTIDGVVTDAYFGELDGVGAHLQLLSGTLPEAAASAGGAQIDVAIPAIAADRLGLPVGSTFVVSEDGRPVTAHVVGTFRIPNPMADFWSQDQLGASGLNAAYIPPVAGAVATEVAFGPLLVARGGLDRIGALAARVQVDYRPTFSSVSPGRLSALINRLDTADSEVPADTASVATDVEYSANASVPLAQIAAELIVTRSTIVVITLLLLVLSIAALAQAARLFSNARAGDRQLMRARGASGAQIAAVASIEAVVIAAVATVASPLLARAVYAVIAAQPPLRAAGVPADAGLPTTAWLTAAGLGAVFILVLVGSLLGPSASFVEAEQARSRARRVTGLLRSGLDLAVVALAVVAFWQLETYRTPVGASASLSIDPVLVAAPALVLLAGALLSLRLVPLLARVAEGIGSRSRGALIPLAAWEIGRRTARASSVVLLLTLALALGAFSQTFLATWRQSQVDQASFAVGPPVRVAADPTDSQYQRSVLSRGAIGEPQPVLRRTADVAESDNGGEDTPAVVLGVPAAGRAMLQRGRLASLGGSDIEALASTAHASTEGVLLPGDPVGIGLTVSVGDPAQVLPGVSTDVRAIVEDAAGVLSTLDLGDVPVDGAAHRVSAMFPSGQKGAALALPLRFDGFQSVVFESNRATYVANPEVQTEVRVRGISSLETRASGATTLLAASVPASVRWNAGLGRDFGGDSKAVSERGWQAALTIGIPADVASQVGTFTLTGWPSISRIPAVVSRPLATTLTVKRGAVLALQFAGSIAVVEIQAITPQIPGAVDTTLLTPSSASGAGSQATDAIVVDQGQLERAIIQFGASGSFVDEWWVDVAPGSATSYLTAHPPRDGTTPPRSSGVLALQMQQDPLRVSTQAALWLAIGVAALLAAIGFAVHSTQTLAARRVEFAQLRAIGLSRRRLIALIATESFLLCVLGAIFGLAVGVGLGVLAGPLIALSPNGTPAVPAVRVLIPWSQLGLLMLIVAVVLALVIAVVARAQRSAQPARILREADNG